MTPDLTIETGLSGSSSRIYPTLRDLPETPPSPPYAVPAECRHLRESTLLNWVNTLLPDSRIASLQELSQNDTFFTFISHLTSSAATPPPGAPNSISHVLDMLQSWLDIPQVQIPVPTDALVHGDQEQLIRLLSFILTQYQAHTIKSLETNTFSFISSHVRITHLYTFLPSYPLKTHNVLRRRYIPSLAYPSSRLQRLPISNKLYSHGQKSRYQTTSMYPLYHPSTTAPSPGATV